MLDSSDISMLLHLYEDIGVDMCVYVCAHVLNTNICTYIDTYRIHTSRKGKKTKKMNRCMYLDVCTYLYLHA